MQIVVAYSEPGQQVSLKVELPDGSSVKAAIERSGILGLFPHIDLAAQKVGVYARVVKLDAALKDGDRVEIYRPITCDPKTVPTRKTRNNADATAAGA
ncbi:RnfH family protein [Aromatoleum toluclasticum]|uniref:RnfH family protein n=1 Tax=Aromatoleum toluclasticum TaxID=92003 RepID=UPI000368F085|nr:RnfH family protein [Aromatoleum toluclasticum]MCC4117752.1 RnfH family protein [Aromatoleum toluclasticum]